jgi:DNA-binding MarR family transcriptional regulator
LFTLRARQVFLSEACLLSQVWHKPGISQTGVAYLLDLETMSVVRHADSLEQADLLQRRPHAGWGSCRRTGVSDPRQYGRRRWRI